MMKKVKVGILGLGRGAYLGTVLMQNGADVVAVCEQDSQKVEKAKNLLGKNIAVFDEFDAMLDYGVDAVLLTNFFHEHAKYAVKALERGIHVLSECISNATMAEGVALVRAAEKSGAIYMLSENYPFMRFNREMKKVYEGGTLGKVLFAEGEYNHPVDPKDTAFVKGARPFEKHWRHFNAATYYITHSLAPLMYITGSRPRRVTAMPIFSPPTEDTPTATYVGDNTAIITTLNDDDSVFRVTGCARFGAHENSYRVACTKGQIENVRGTDGKIMLRYNAWDVPEGMEENNFYTPEENSELAKNAGHGGGDFYIMKEFMDCIREGRRPVFDEYFATNAASVAILGHRSLMSLGQPYDIPDFRYENDRKKYENDWATPFWGSDGTSPNIPCCSRPEYRPSQTQLDRYHAALEE